MCARPAREWFSILPRYAVSHAPQFHQHSTRTKGIDRRRPRPDDYTERQEIRSVTAGQARVEFGEVRYRRTKVSSNILFGGEPNVSRQSLVDTRERIRCLRSVFLTNLFEHVFAHRRFGRLYHLSLRQRGVTGQIENLNRVGARTQDPLGLFGRRHCDPG